MTGPAVAPYGEWPSPLSAEQATAGAHRPVEAAFAGDAVWWSEPVAAEHRTGVFREGPAGPEAVLPAPWSARSRVHEYGGGAWVATDDGVLVFVEASDQRLYRLRAGGEPVALTEADGHVRFGSLTLVGDAVLAVRERHTGPRPTDVERDLVRVPVAGGAARSVVAGSRFLAHPAVSPDGTRLAWIAWDHPHMPWESSELRVGRLVDGRVDAWTVLAGGPRESVLQPEWRSDDRLTLLSDRSGWWNLVEVSAEGGPLTPLHAIEAETGGPLWDLGTRWYGLLGDGRVLLTRTVGADEQMLLDLHSGEATVLRGGRSRTSIEAVQGDRVLVLDDAADAEGGLQEFDLATGRFRLVRSVVDGVPEEVYPTAEQRTFHGVHAIVYPPHNALHVGPPGEAPPYVAFIHGGPSSHRGPMRSLAYAYYTSRGIGVVDVNHGGSTGYGRAYRERLDGQWGVVDVADVRTVVTGLADAGLADPARLAIEGGSAGGWTVLSSLIGSDVFAAGVSLYGVADLVGLLEDTHDFEATYLDGLVGPYPESAEVYAARAPINRVADLDRPVLLLQGLEDEVVPPAQSQRFRDALVARGVPHAYLEFAGEGHGFRRRETLIRVREAALSFLGQVLGFTPPDVPVLPLWRSRGKAEDGTPVARRTDPEG